MLTILHPRKVVYNLFSDLAGVINTEHFLCYHEENIFFFDRKDFHVIIFQYSLGLRGVQSVTNR